MERVLLQSAAGQAGDVPAGRVSRPALLRTNLQLREEYTDILFCSNPKIAPVQIDVYAYYTETDAWALISDKHAALEVLESGSFDEELALCSGLAAAQRAVRGSRRRGGVVRRGLLVIEGRIWQWTRLTD